MMVIQPQPYHLTPVPLHRRIQQRTCSRASYQRRWFWSRIVTWWWWPLNHHRRRHHHYHPVFVHGQGRNAMWYDYGGSGGNSACTCLLVLLSVVLFITTCCTIITTMMTMTRWRNEKEDIHTMPSIVWLQQLQPPPVLRKTMITRITTATTTTTTTTRGRSNNYNNEPSYNSDILQPPDVSMDDDNVDRHNSDGIVVVPITMMTETEDNNKKKKNQDESQQQDQFVYSSNNHMEEVEDDEDIMTTQLHLQQILHAEMSLIDLRLDLSKLRSWDVTTIHEPYTGIYATFCYINWTIYSEQPNIYPMYNDLIQQHKYCNIYNDNDDGNNEVEQHPHILRNIDLRKITNLARRYDNNGHPHAVFHNHPSVVYTTSHQRRQHHPRHSNQQQQQQQHHRRHQQELHLSSSSSSSLPITPPLVTVLNLTTMIFHESRCGSTLLTNILASCCPIIHNDTNKNDIWDTSPPPPQQQQRYRVYSEPRPLLQAMTHICGEDYSVCSIDTAAAILLDTIYMMSRSSSGGGSDGGDRRNSHTQQQQQPGAIHVVYKLPSIATRNLPVFIKAFPHIPYILLYRDPIEVMVSHFHPKVPDSSTVSLVQQQQHHHQVKSSARTNQQNETQQQQQQQQQPLTIKCLSQRHSPGMSVVDVVRKYNHHPRKSNNVSSSVVTNDSVVVLAKTLSDTDYCAAHLASITEMMVSTITPNAIVINYRNLLKVLLQDDHIVSKLLLQTVVPNDDINSTTTTTSRISLETRTRIEHMASLYSKNRNIGRRSGGDDIIRQPPQQQNDSKPRQRPNSHLEQQSATFVTDTDQKLQLASPEIYAAVSNYLLPSYRLLEEMENY